tara:strand:+ start:63 stop:713 length:651 start_codon:yes stop_codon:yes gene_type:complete
MVKKNFYDDFTFVCYTENSLYIDERIEIRPLNMDYDLEKWWWKLTLFEKSTDKPTMFLDLDIVIQHNITHFKDYCKAGKICTVKAYWKPHARDLPPIPPGYNMDLNSSIIVWNGDLTHVWKQFYDQADYLMCKYQGIDSYLYFHHKNILEFFPRNEIYSRLHGMDEEQMWWHGPKAPLFYDDTYSICIFNKWKMDKKFGGPGIDDNAYIGFEKYWI